MSSFNYSETEETYEILIPINFIEKRLCEIDKSRRSIIEGDQNQVAVFSLEHFSNLTCSAWAFKNAKILKRKNSHLILVAIDKTWSHQFESKFQ